VRRMGQVEKRKRARGFGRLVAKIREINRKYAEPRIHMSRGVKIALLLLRVYLIFLVLVLAYKFITSFKP
jgi:hypothetical protein